MLEDTERFEVVSSPGSTLWGVNAVNGVTNIITRSARDTRRCLARTGVAKQELPGGSATVRTPGSFGIGLSGEVGPGRTEPLAGLSRGVKWTRSTTLRSARR